MRRARHRAPGDIDLERPGSPPAAGRAGLVSRRNTRAGQHEETARRVAPALRDAAEWLGHAFHERWLLACGVAHGIGLHHGKVSRAIAAAIEDTSGSLPGATGAEFRGALRAVAAEIRSDSVCVLVEDAALPDAAEHAVDDLIEELAIKGLSSTDFHAGFERLDDPGEHPGRVPATLRQGVFERPGPGALMPDDSGQSRGASGEWRPRALGRAHRHGALTRRPARPVRTASSPLRQCTVTPVRERFASKVRNR